MLIALGIIAIIVLLLFLPLKVVFSYHEKVFSTKVFIFGVRVFKHSPKPKNKKDKKKDNAEDMVKKAEKSVGNLGERIRHYASVSKKATTLARKYAKIKSIRLRMKIGVGDAPSTAISTGIIWGQVYTLIGIIGSIMYIDNHDVEITPVYNESVLSLDGECIIESRIVYIIFIAITILIKINSRKGKEE